MPPSASAAEQQVLLGFTVDEAHRQQADAAQSQAHAMDAAPVAFARRRHQARTREESHGILHRVTNPRPLRAALEQVGRRIVGAEDHRHGVGEVQPHAEQAQPGEELHQRQPLHRGGHLGQGVRDFPDAGARARCARLSCGETPPGLPADIPCVESTVHSTAPKKAAAPM